MLRLVDHILTTLHATNNTTRAVTTSTTFSRRLFQSDGLLCFFIVLALLLPIILPLLGYYAYT